MTFVPVLDASIVEPRLNAVVDARHRCIVREDRRVVVDDDAVGLVYGAVTHECPAVGKCLGRGTASMPFWRRHCGGNLTVGPQGALVAGTRPCSSAAEGERFVGATNGGLRYATAPDELAWVCWVVAAI